LRLTLLIVALVAPTMKVYATSTTTAASSPADFTLPIVDQNGPTGKSLTLSHYRGSVVVLLFFGPWCPPCQSMAPFMDGLYAQFSPKGAVFIQVAEPWGPRQASHGYQNVTVEQFLTVHQTNITTVLDTPSWIAANIYAWSALPTLYVIFRNFTIAGNYTGVGNVEANASTLITTALVTPVSEFGDALLIVAACLATTLFVVRRRRT